MNCYVQLMRLDTHVPCEMILYSLEHYAASEKTAKKLIKLVSRYNNIIIGMV